MPEMKFDYHRVDSRKDLIHFVEEHGDQEVLEHIGDNPQAWVEELSLLNQTLTRNPLVGGVGLDQPPVDEPDFRELGNGAFYYRGKYDRLRGLWIRRPVGKDLEEITGDQFEWTHYRMGGRAVLMINQEFSNIPFEEFLPENFEQKAKPFEKEGGFSKRPISTFSVHNGEREMVVFAKGADVSLSYFSAESKPSYRLTSIANISKTTSKREMGITLELGDLGVNVPRVIGYYESPLEEFLFLEEVRGKKPDDFLPKSREEIIRQDAEMLATLCLAGYRKIGFTDFDDKVFDGANLYLIDVDECRDLYSEAAPDFREVLLNPKKAKGLRIFRKLQREIFTVEMKDAVFKYRDSLTPANEDRANYVRAFHQRMGWREPDERQMKGLIDFPGDYMTHDGWMSMMCESD